jgi:hypothetical protein
MMCMAPPQHGQPRAGTLAGAMSSATGLAWGDGATSRSRALAMLSALPPLARKPVWRMRWKPFGST